jgi:hypothetical protein
MQLCGGSYLQAHSYANARSRLKQSKGLLAQGGRTGGARAMACAIKKLAVEINYDPARNNHVSIQDRDLRACPTAATTSVWRTEDEDLSNDRRGWKGRLVRARRFPRHDQSRGEQHLMRNRLAAAIGLAFIGLTPAAYAQQGPLPNRIGTERCAEMHFDDVVSDNTKLLVQTLQIGWIIGYWSGMNAGNQTIGKLGEADIMQAVIAECRSYPDGTLQDAINLVWAATRKADGE